jgi:Mn2+/Fe2+ NRAMP family transporter
MEKTMLRNVALIIFAVLLVAELTGIKDFTWFEIALPILIYISVKVSVLLFVLVVAIVANR